MRLLGALAIVLSAAVPAAADVVHLRGGGRIVGRVEETEGAVRVEMAGGTMTLPRERVESIERVEPPADEFARRRRALADGDAKEAASLAAFADGAGLSAERGELLELASRWAPGDATVRAELGRWRVFERPLPPNPAAETALAASLAPGARIWLTPHWRIAYGGDAAAARRRGELLEAAWKKLRALVERTGVVAHPVADRLECVVYEDHADWLKGSGLPEESLEGLVGVYVAQTRRILLYDTRTSPAAKESDVVLARELASLADARKTVEAQRASLRDAEQALADATARGDAEARLAAMRTWIESARAALAANDRDLDARDAALQRYRDDAARHFDAENVSSTTHEACHQIAFALGVSRGGQALWLIEGLATLFEAQSRTNFVLEAPNFPRLKDVRAAWDRGQADRLRDVVTDAIFDAKGRGSSAYAASWSLTFFLANRRPGEFARYLAEGLLQPATGRCDARLADFQRFFGEDLDALEREWKGYVGRL